MKKNFITYLICLIAITVNAKTTQPEKNYRALKTQQVSDEGNKIKFTIGSKTFDLNSYNLNYFPSENEKNTNIYQTTNFNVGIKSSKIDQELLDWIFSENQQPLNAEITVYDGDSGNVIRTLTFTGVRTNNFSENYNSNNGFINQYINLSFKYKTVKIKIKH